MTTYFYGIDGGKSTGAVCIARQKIIWRRQATPEEILSELDARMARHGEHRSHPVLIGYEVFRQSGPARVTVQPEARDTAVRVEDLAARHGYLADGQTAADAKHMVPDSLLRAAGLWTLPSEIGESDANDVNDAARHALLVMARKRASEFDGLLQRAYQA